LHYDHDRLQLQLAAQEADVARPSELHLPVDKRGLGFGLGWLLKLKAQAQGWLLSRLLPHCILTPIPAAVHVEDKVDGRKEKKYDTED
jgi:hypothetical protein